MIFSDSDLSDSGLHPHEEQGFNAAYEAKEVLGRGLNTKHGNTPCFLFKNFIAKHKKGQSNQHYAKTNVFMHT